MALDRQSIEKKDFPVGRRGYDPEAVDSHLSQLADEVTAGHIRLRVADVYPPERAVEAYLLMEAGGLRGRAVITF